MFGGSSARTPLQPLQQILHGRSKLQVVAAGFGFGGLFDDDVGDRAAVFHVRVVEQVPTAEGQADERAVEREWEILRSPGWTPSYNLAPSQQAAILRQDVAAGGKVLESMTWGLTPAWAREPYRAAAAAPLTISMDSMSRVFKSARPPCVITPSMTISGACPPMMLVGPRNCRDGSEPA